MRVLIVEDNPKMAGAIRKGLLQHNYAVDVVDKGFEAEEAVVENRYDLVVLDLMLPDRDGVDVCRNLRRRGVATPILMLTALADTESKVAGLDAGADDYLTKPFEFRRAGGAHSYPLAARPGGRESRTQVRRPGVRPEPATDYEGRAHHQFVGQETALLEYFMRNPDRVLARQTLVEKIWDTSYQPVSNAIDVHISALRKKIDRDFDEAFIHTVVGAGYRFGRAHSDTPGSASTETSA